MHDIATHKLQNAARYICDNSSIYFSCILKNEAAGLIWGNRKTDPDFLLVWSPYQIGFQLMGKPLNNNEWDEFRNWFEAVIIPFLKEQGIDYFEYGADTDELAVMFRNIFSDTKIYSDYQKLFHWRKSNVSFQVPCGYQIIKADRSFLQKEYINKDFITDEIIHAYSNIETYFKYGLAYVALKDNTVVARADMLFSNNGYGNISVNTIEEHRKKGLSACLTMKTIEAVCQAGLIPVWDCTEDNIASEKTALKCGFQMVKKDIISWFLLDEYAVK